MYKVNNKDTRTTPLAIGGEMPIGGEMSAFYIFVKNPVTCIGTLRKEALLL